MHFVACFKGEIGLQEILQKKSNQNAIGLQRNDIPKLTCNKVRTLGNTYQLRV